MTTGSVKIIKESAGISPLEIIEKFYSPGSLAFEVLVGHGRAVARKSLEVARAVLHLKPDLDFINEAAMLHDIGIIKVHAPDIGCTGDAPYLLHGILGREMLEAEGLERHALVCERHVGTGITAQEIRENRLPLPERDMVPLSIEEKIVAYADKFFSKNPRFLDREKTVSDVVNNLKKHGQRQVDTFLSWVELFEPGRAG